MQGQRPPVAGRGLALVALAFGAALVAMAARYGYHRDELYFVAIGGHPAFGYVDQPPLVPLLAHAVDALSGHSLLWLRVPAALAGAAVVVVTGLIAREFGAGRAGQLFAAGCMAVSAVLVAVSHLASTSVFDLLTWTVLSWLVVRGLAGADERIWLLVGAVAGVGLQVKTLPVFLLAALTASLLVVGPRRVFASRWLWAGAALALLLWAPNLVWQAAHGWPQLELSSAIARGESGTSASRLQFVPFQLLLISPVLVPVWVAGLVRLWRSPDLRPWRAWAPTYALLVVVFVVTGGKPYYLCGTYPVLLAAGAQPTLDWARRGSAAVRRALLAGALVLSGAVSAVLFLPVVPAGSLHSTPIVAVNYDAGETVGWPRFAATVGGVYDALPDEVRGRAVVLTENYGEAGALLRYRRDLPTYGTQNSMADLGAPPGRTDTVVAVGYGRERLLRWFAECRAAATIDNGVDVDDDEQGAPVSVCTAPRRPWSQLWPDLRHLG